VEERSRAGQPVAGILPSPWRNTIGLGIRKNVTTGHGPALIRFSP